MSTTLNIKVGQKWKTRKGDVVEIAKAIEDGEWSWKAASGDKYTKSGGFYGNGEPSSFDLIELVEDALNAEAQTKKLDIKVGQKWKTRGGDVAEVHGRVRTSEGWRWRLHGKNIWLVNDAGCYAAVPNDFDLIELVEDVAPPTAELPKSESALDTQVGGNHYKDMAIQPVEFIHKNKIGFIPGNVIKYVCRADKKNGLEDLMKARHYLDLLIEMESAK